VKALDWDKAEAIYTLGGNSGAHAVVTVSALGADAAKGAAVKQGGTTVGSMKEKGPAGATSIKVSYKNADICRDGGLATKDVSGCISVGGGSLSVGDTDVDIGPPTAVTNKYRSLAGFSTAAESKMAGQEFYVPYKEYYKEGDYAHQRVMAALKQTGICSGCDDAARIELAKKTSAFMNVWMYVIRELEDAINDCNAGCITCNDDMGVHAWDEGWVFYAGSLEGKDGSGSGKLIYNLADKRCPQFGTCLTEGGSAVNAALLRLFDQGKVALQEGKCSDVPKIKKRIVELMSVPLVQGSLRYAYIVAELNGDSKAKAEGAAFSAAILPRINACNAEAASVISANMNIDSSGPMASGFAAVKNAFESTYDCLGITCEHVGGYMKDGQYYAGAESCGEVSKGSCYNARGDHSVDCDIDENGCTGSWYKPGFTSGSSGCCHCKASCLADAGAAGGRSGGGCKYSSIKTTEAPSESESQATESLATEAPTASGSVHIESSSVLFFGTLLFSLTLEF